MKTCLRTKLLQILSVGLCLGSIGCATTGSYTLSGEKIIDVKASLKKGDIRLTCGIGCSGASGYHRRQKKMMHDNALWHDLALKVVNVGFEMDREYYYLGRSAEGLGYFDAALTYYKLAKTVFKCGGVIDNCDGLVFPRDIDQRLLIVERSLKNITNERLSSSQSKNLPTLKNDKPKLSEPPVNTTTNSTSHEINKKQFQEKIPHVNPSTFKNQIGELE